MRATIDGMISSGSLSAFSASATNGAVSVRPSPPVQQARAQSAAPPSRMSGQGGGTQGQSPVQPAPGQILPRGSLLNLSV